MKSFNNRGEVNNLSFFLFSFCFSLKCFDSFPVVVVFEIQRLQEMQSALDNGDENKVQLLLSKGANPSMVEKV